MKLQLRGKLLYVTASLIYKNRQIHLQDVVIDTGSSGTVFSKNKVSTIGLIQEPKDISREISGVGGSELIFIKQVDNLVVGELQLSNFNIEVGDIQYGFNIDGIIGLDFLLQTKAIIDLDKLEITTSHT
jgi:predicted aspartyl protease